MPRSSLNWYKSVSRRISNDIRLIPRTELSVIFGSTPQGASYKVLKVYPRLLEELIQVLDIAGYEIREKENDE